MKQIGFIGVGVMGSSMVRNLMKNGFSVSVYTRTKSKAEPVIAEGAVWCDSVAECVKEKDAVITIVGYPKDVEEVYFGEAGILDNAPKGCTVIDMTTTSPSLAKRIYEEASARGIKALDAPVSGGDTGAKNGTLAIMVGGDKEVFDACQDIFRAMGTNIVYEGPASMGQHCKMANQICLSGALAGVCEAISYARATGLDPATMLDTIGTGAAASWQLSNNGYKMLQQDYAPGFYSTHFIKDMKLAEGEAQERQLSMPVLRQVLSMFLQLDEMGFGLDGTQALIKVYEENKQ
ncbi:MAG: NAD(P)-dependent oxidoreductase [Firmicutes bacterium]|nr:NAD(P)-dependent oxidoreductase [Bacillota bacterium]